MSSEWNPNGLTQEEFMLKDEVITVDENDSITGSANKKSSHTFSVQQPRGILHRAFSVFLFNDEGKLLLQQRASEKITFPDVWTNTCCSHPLYMPSEIDSNENIANGSVPGAKAAAVRKLKHELGIECDQVTSSQFKFLTRLHYWAADVVTHGKKSIWGEHEIDYILFIKVKSVNLNPNAEEVRDTKFVDLKELQAMMDPKSGLIWSPWFRIIAEKFLPKWWSNLNETLSTQKFVDCKKIWRFDPTSEHMGGAGNAQAWLGDLGSPYDSTSAPKVIGDKGSKQGSYGKVQIHKHSKLDQISRVDEIFAALWFKYVAVMPNKVNVNDENIKFCDDMLGKVSRSFASVIRQLPTGLCIDIMIFYLALRALDTIEDDMTAFKGKEQEKLDHLNNFYKVALVTEGWSMDGVGEGDEKVLLQQYSKCVVVFKKLSPASQEVIADITKRMGQGMASYVEKDMGQGTVTVEDYNLYCHYVAGLVGEGLSRLFSCSGYESVQVEAVSKTLANTMGLFLQKTNIIRDYLEDYVDKRAWWPKEIWSLYAKSGDLGEFANPASITPAVHCLNHLVTNALECVPECLQYMDLLKTEEVFRFCAIPQVMAIATLCELYSNEKVFTGVVKIRKGMAAKLILDTKSKHGLHKWFYLMTMDIKKRVSPSDPNAKNTLKICDEILKLTTKYGRSAVVESYSQVFATAVAPVCMIVGLHYFSSKNDFSGKKDKFELPVIESSLDCIVLIWIVINVIFICYYNYAISTRESLRKAD